jgi:hypothetical protein
MKNNNETSGTKAVRLKNSLSCAIMQKVDELNKIRKGNKKLYASDIIEPAFALLQDKHFEQILASTVTNTNRFEDGWKNYKTKVSPVSYDEWLGLIGDGKVRLSEYLSPPIVSHKKSSVRGRKNQLTNYSKQSSLSGGSNAQ